MDEELCFLQDTDTKADRQYGIGYRAPRFPGLFANVGVTAAPIREGTCLKQSSGEIFIISLRSSEIQPNSKFSSKRFGGCLRSAALSRMAGTGDRNIRCLRDWRTNSAAGYELRATSLPRSAGGSRRR